MIADGKKVKFHYTLKVKGEVADSSEGKEPLEYVHGQQMIIPGLERQLTGLNVGEEKTIFVGPEDGYGTVDSSAIVEFPKGNLPEGIQPEVGMMIQLEGKDGRALPGMITEVREETVLLNFNHPLAGQELEFTILIVDIK